MLPGLKPENYGVKKEVPVGTRTHNEPGGQPGRPVPPNSKPRQEDGSEGLLCKRAMLLNISLSGLAAPCPESREASSRRAAVPRTDGEANEVLKTTSDLS